MCDPIADHPSGYGRAVALEEAVGAVLAHDITEIRKGGFKGAAFRKGHIVRREDICRLRRIGKERLFVLDIAADQMHEDEAALLMARSLMGEGVCMKGEPREGKVTITAAADGMLSVDRDALLRFNMKGDVMCATLHDGTVVRKGQAVAGTRAIPLVVGRGVVEDAVRAAESARSGEAGGVISVRAMRRPRAGVVITGNEVYHGRISDAFAPVIRRKIEQFGGAVVDVHVAPDDAAEIEARLRELIGRGCDLLITTGGMSVDPDDVTRFAIGNLGASGITYGSAVLPGAMFLVAYLDGSPLQMAVPILGIPACGMYHATTVFDLVLPRILTGRRLGRRELAGLGHGGLCLNCEVCRYPVCPFGKG